MCGLKINSTVELKRSLDPHTEEGGRYEVGRDNPQWGVAVANLILWFGVFSYGFTHIFPHNKRGASHLFYLVDWLMR